MSKPVSGGSRVRREKYVGWRAAATLLLVATTGMLSSCEHGSDLLAKASGPTCFAKSLSREYWQLSFALEQTGYSHRAAAYQERAREVSAGKIMEPVTTQWDPPDTLPSDLRDALAEFNALEPAGLAAEPFALAHAQGRLDCWSEFARKQRDSEAKPCQVDFKAAQCYLAYRLDPQFPMGQGEADCMSIYGPGKSPALSLSPPSPCGGD